LQEEGRQVGLGTRVFLRDDAPGARRASLVTNHRALTSDKQYLGMHMNYDTDRFIAKGGALTLV
jgi:hypothetical protein